MKRSRSLNRIVLATGLVLVASALFTSSAFAQATRTWVSGVGDDANPCSRTAPCKTWAGAISKTAEGGEIDALDPGGYGPVTVTKAITLNGNGFGSTLASGFNAININAGVGDDVIIRDMSIQGTGQVAACLWTGLTAVNVIAARTVRIDDVEINNFQNGIATPASGSNPDIHLDVTVNNARISNTCNAGINAVPAAGHSVRLAVKDSTISNANVGLNVAPGAEAWVLGSSISLNNVGPTGGGPIHDMGGNMAVGNATAGAFTDSVNQPVVQPAPAPTYCVVPKLGGKSKSGASSALTAAGCKAGKTSYKKLSKKQKKSKGKVLAQTIPAGVSVKVGTGVGVTLGK